MNIWIVYSFYRDEHFIRKDYTPNYIYIYIYVRFQVNSSSYEDTLYISRSLYTLVRQREKQSFLLHVTNYEESLLYIKLWGKATF